MKKIASVTGLLVLCAAQALAQRSVEEDVSGEQALLTWSRPAGWEAGLAYAHVSRDVDLEGQDTRLKADIVDAEIGVSPWSWLLLYGRAGGSEARLTELVRDESGPGGGGGLGALLNLWQLYEGVQVTAWRVTLQLAGQYMFRTTQDDGDGQLQWGEALVWLPLNYHLSFARTFRNSYMAEFQSLAVYAGPAFSKVDGTWTRGDTEQDFEEEDSFGVVGGGEFWLLENLSFGARAEWFEKTSLQATVRYRF